MIFREGTTDEQIYRHIYMGDEYRLEKCDLNKNELIVDIGCHIGSFSKKAWDCGFKNIRAFEASHETYEIAKQNLNKSIKLENRAVWGIDENLKFFNTAPVTQKGTRLINHGANRIMTTDSETNMKTILFSEIANEQIGLLKMDCEGAEYSIVYENLNLLKNVKNIVMECHDIRDTKTFFGKTFSRPTNTAGMRDALREAGFHVRQKGGGRLAVLYATS